MTALIAALALALAPLSPAPVPDPNPYGDTQLLPTYTTNGDGSRMQCTPNASQCWPDSTGLPSYLTGA